MQRADGTATDRLADGTAPGAVRGGRNHVSATILAAVACMPIVVAVGFLTDRSPDASGLAAVPADIALSTLRGPLEATPEGSHAPR